MPGCQWRPITHKKTPRSASTCFCIYIKYCYWLIQESGSAHWKPSKSFSIHGTVNSCRYKVHCSGRAGGLAMVEAYPLGYVATTQRAVLQSVAADLTTANVTAGQEDDLSLQTHRDKTQSVLWMSVSVSVQRFYICSFWSCWRMIICM